VTPDFRVQGNTAVLDLSPALGHGRHASRTRHRSL
jgi:hypothetical protein